MPEFLLPELKPLLMLVAALALAACGATTGTTSQPMPVVRTPEQIKGDCWMKYEGDTKLNIDKRAVLVDQCIAERGKTQAPIN